MDHHDRFTPLADNFEETALTDEIKLQVIYAVLDEPPVAGSHIDRPGYHLDRFAYAVELAGEPYLRSLHHADFRREAFAGVCTRTAQRAEQCLHQLKHIEIYDLVREPDITYFDAACVIHGWAPNSAISEFARVCSPFDDRAEDLYRTHALLTAAARRDYQGGKSPLADWVGIAHAHGIRITHELQHATGITDVLPEEIIDGRSPQERQLRSAEKNVARYKELLKAANAKLASFRNRDQDVADAVAVILYDELNKLRGEEEKELSLRDVEQLLDRRGVHISHNTWANQYKRGRAYLQKKQK